MACRCMYVEGFLRGEEYFYVYVYREDKGARGSEREVYMQINKVRMYIHTYISPPLAWANIAA